VGDWANTANRVKPGGKVYLFTGPGCVLDWLIGRATAGVTHRYTIRPPFTADDLGVVLGTGDETQAIIVRDIERATEAEWYLISHYLEPAKTRGQSLLLAGQHSPDLDVVKSLRTKISRQGFIVDGSDPTGLMGRKSLVQWVAEEWQTTMLAATRACERSNFSVAGLIFASRAFLAMSSGQPVEGAKALRLVDLAVPVRQTEHAYRLLLDRSPDALPAVRGLTPTQTLHLFRLIESALTDIELLYPVLSAGLSVKSAADKTGLHIVRVLELAEWAPRYPPSVALQCRQILALGLSNFTQPEAARTVAILWS
jgi:hypothetical protein